jgi:rhamnose transport system permease protein
LEPDTQLSSVASALAGSDGAPGAGPEPLRGRRIGGTLSPLLRWETGLVVLLIGVVIFGLDTSSAFTSDSYLFSQVLGGQVGEIALMTLPMALIIITGEIDLSVASTAGMASSLMGYLFMHHWSIALIFVTVLAMGAVAGAFNGFLVTRVGLPSLAVTIGTLTLYRGIAIGILGANTYSTFPTFWTNIGVNPVPGLPFMSWAFLIFLVMAALVGIVLHMTPLGRTLFAIGANREAAQFAGIRVKRTKFMLYTFSGVVCAFVGILLTFRLNTAVSNNAYGLELTVVATALLGGISIFGGKGTIVGVLLANLVFAGIEGALYLTTGFNESAFPIVTGGLLLASVLIPNFPELRRRAREAVHRRRRLHGAAPSVEQGVSR